MKGRGAEHRGACPARGIDVGGRCLGVCQDCTGHKVVTPECPAPHCAFCDACWDCGASQMTCSPQHHKGCRTGRGDRMGVRRERGIRLLAIGIGVPYAELMVKVQRRLRGRRVKEVPPCGAQQSSA